MLLVRYQLEFAILAVAPELKRPRSDLVLWPDGQAPSIVILLQALFGRKPLPHVLWKNHVQQQEVCFKREIGRATSELQSLMRISYAVFCLKKNNCLCLPHINTHTNRASS